MGKQKLPKGIRTRGAKFFVDVTFKGQRKTSTCDTLEDALARRAELQSAMATGKEAQLVCADTVSWTLQQALDKTLTLPKPRGWKDISYEKQATLNATDAINFFGPDQKIADLSFDLIDTWLHDCEARGNSASTINRKLSALSKIAKVAYEYGGLTAPLRTPQQRKERVGRLRYITDREEDHMSLWCLSQGGSVDDFWDALIVLLDTGMRRGELLNLRPVDVDLETGVIMIMGTEGRGTKNGKIRSAPMTKRVKEVMKRHQTGATCFNITESYLRHSWDAMREALGLSDDKDFVLHVCRHTCASRLIKAGVSLPVVQAWLGHSNIMTTMRYSHLYPKDLMNAVKSLESRKEDVA